MHARVPDRDRRPLLRTALAAAFAAAGWSLGPPDAAAEPKVTIPRFHDPAAGTAKPDLGTRRVVRFLTTQDWPPFQYLGPEGAPIGFNVDLARALCGLLELSCTMQAWAWDDIVTALNSGRADAAIAGLRPTPEMRKRVDFTNVYFRLPARFVGRRAVDLGDATPESLAGKTVAALQNSAHEAFLRAFFPDSVIKSFARAEDARLALKEGRVDVLFGDGVALALWLDGTPSEQCCAFVGGPYLESRFFGEGLAVAVRKGDTLLASALNHALIELESAGTLAEIYLRWFPIGIY